ncbi:MAG: hypothetical protein ACRDPY_07665, partial [Streptosporangiaceae bacterium]
MSPARRILAALGALDVADGPISRLQAARRLREAGAVAVKASVPHRQTAHSPKMQQCVPLGSF